MKKAKSLESWEKQVQALTLREVTEILSEEDFKALENDFDAYGDDQVCEFEANRVTAEILLRVSSARGLNIATVLEGDEYFTYTNEYCLINRMKYILTRNKKSLYFEELF